MKSFIQILILFSLFGILYATNLTIDYYNYAVTQHRKKNYNIAKNAYTSLLNNINKDVAYKSAFNLGCIYLDEKKYDSALIFFEYAIKKDPYNFDAKYNYTYALLKLESFKQESIFKNNKNTKGSNIDTATSDKKILNIIKIKEQESHNKYFNKFQIEPPKSKYPW